MSNIPRIITEREFNVSLNPPESSRDAVMIGTASWGPMNTLTSLTRFSQFLETFGDETSSGVSGVKGAELFFSNGSPMKFLRVGDGNEAKSSLTLQNGTTDVITLTAKYNGTTGDNISAEIIDNGGNRDIVLQLGSTIERYTNGGAGFDSNTDIVNRINNNSTLVDAVEDDASLIDATSKTFLTGGNDGEGVTTTDIETAFDSHLATEEFNFLVTPDFTDDSLHTSLTSKIETKATAEKKRSRYLSGIEVDESLTSINGRTTSSTRFELVAPNVKYLNRNSETEVVLDGSYLACAVAGILCSVEPNISATNEILSIRGLSVNESSGKNIYNTAEIDDLIENSVTVCGLVNGTYRIIRSVTTIGNITNAEFETIIVDTIDTTSNRIEEVLQAQIGQPNTESRRASLVQKVNSTLDTLTEQGYLNSFKDTVIEVGNSPDTINCEVNVKPVFSTNFIRLTITSN